MANFGEGYRFHVTGLTHDVYGFPTEKPDEIDALMHKFKNKEIRNTKDLTMVDELPDGRRRDLHLRGRFRGAFGPAGREDAPATQRAGSACCGRRLSGRSRSRRSRRCWIGCSCVLVPEMNVGQLRKEVERLARSSRTPVKGLNVLNPTMISAEQIIGRLRALGAIAESSLEGVRQHG